MSDIKAFLFDDDRGVSPVIGVILMVAITVILAAVIAAFVLGLGDTNESAPSVTWEYDYNGADAVDVTMTGGESFDPARVTFTGDNLDTSNGDRGGSGETWADATSPGNPVTAGETITIGVSGDSFDLDIIWTSESGDTSSEIGGTTGPEA